MPKIEGYWDCAYCGNKAIRGGIQTCPGCGKTRAADTKFYMLDTVPVADESKVGTGPDWFCPYCDSYNPDSVKVCRNCGHEREASDENYFELRKKQEQKAAEAAARQKEPVPKRSFFRRHRLLLLALLVLLGIVGAKLFANRDQSVRITDASWEREIVVQQRQLVEESDWTLPSDAVEQKDARREIHHYDSVLDHYEQVPVQRSREVLDGYDVSYTYEDMGNGYFNQVEHQTPRYRTEYYTEIEERPVYVDVPVYETKYTYTAYRWINERSETARGQTDPQWPQVTYGTDEREGERIERYTLTYADRKGNQRSFSCDYGMFSRVTIGQSYTVKLRGGAIAEIVK